MPNESAPQSDKFNDAIAKGINTVKSEQSKMQVLIDEVFEGLKNLEENPDMQGRFSFRSTGYQIKLKVDGKKIGFVSARRNDMSVTLFGSTSYPKTSDGVLSAVAEGAYRKVKTPKRSLGQRLGF